MTTGSQAQARVAAWFDDIYRRRGVAYLRPPEAYPIFLQLVGARPGERLLDVACGAGRLLGAAAAWGLSATGIDLSAEGLALARREVPGARVLRANAEALPFAAGTFHRVTCLGSLERFLHRERALREMTRVLRPGGRLCVMVRNAESPLWLAVQRALGRQNHAGHQDAMTLPRWRALFDAAGLDVEAVHPDQWPRQRLRRLLGRGRPAAPGRPEPVARPLLHLRLADELIFLLRPRAR